MNNPTRDLLEKTISSLELAATTNTGGRAGATRTTEEDCDKDTEESSAMATATATATTCAFSSGMAAVSSLLLAISSQTQQPLPLHVIVPTDVYHGVPTVLSSVLTNQLGISSSAVDMTSLQGIQLELERILKLEEKKKCNILIWMESPSNPQCQVVDIEQVSQYVGTVRDALKQSGGGDGEGIDIVTAVDSTWSPPTITKPLMVSSSRPAQPAYQVLILGSIVF
jgi:cystathionine beta-lyase/cystathionine gamma-synthase